MLELIVYPPLIIIVYYWFCIEPGEIFDFIPELFKNAPNKIKKITYDCPMCMTGQLAFWSNVLYYWNIIELPQMIANTSISILIAFFLDQIIAKIKE
jgi:hypothetical protein